MSMIDDPLDHDVSFDPNAIGNKTLGIFGLPFTPQEAHTVIIPVPWDVTTSYGGGAWRGPEAVLEASYQVDLYHEAFPTMWKKGIALLPISEEWIAQNALYRLKAEGVIAKLEQGLSPSQDDMRAINAISDRLNQWVESQARHWLGQGKKIGILGGDHSTPLGLLRALAKQYLAFGVLHVDAHMDLRVAYEGFEYSHASIMYNALSLPAISHVVQVGIRDACEQEWDLVNQSQGRVQVVSNASLQSRLFIGESFDSICTDIVDRLPSLVYVSIDIDGLDPSLCPHTGTPVPGGLSFDQLMYLLAKLAQSGKQVIGFDLVEVCPTEGTTWNENVGARVLYHLFGYSG